jgi:hypothetical protein
MLDEGVSIWTRVSGIDDKKHVYTSGEFTVAFANGQVQSRTTANCQVTCRVIETYNNTMENMHLFDDKRDALSELIVDENYSPE